jgi:DNA-binding NtrC family response regulator
MESKRKILLIGKKSESSNLLEQVIEHLGYRCLKLTHSSNLLDFVSLERPDIVITDLNGSEKDGLDILKELRKCDPNSVVIILTANATLGSAIEALRFGAFDYLIKPVSQEQLEAAIRRAAHCKFLSVQKNLSIMEKLEAAIRKVTNPKRPTVDKVSLLKQISENQSSDNVIIGKSKVMQEIFDQVMKISKTDANVMIYGESGTGKELIAHSIHANSHRKTKAFIAIDCVALPETLLASELFGYEKGAFTGAESRREGLLEYADHGTLFLDEICELAPNLQAKLLRVVQQNEFRRVGGKRLLKVNLRIISATNRDPAEAVRTGQLRPDLYYRLNVIPLELPPLRARKEDIPMLVKYFLGKFGAVTNGETKMVDPPAMEAMMNYDWPGNVRELKNLVERVVTLTDGPKILLSDLPRCVRNSTEHENLKYAITPNLPFLEARRQIMQEFEKEYLANLLKQCAGNISKAANIAKISRRTMYRVLNSNQFT